MAIKIDTQAWLDAHDPEDTEVDAANYLQDDGSCACCGVHFIAATTERWRIVLTDYGSISGEIEWHSDTITDAQWHINQAWGRWHELPGSDGAVLLSDSLIARVYDTTKITDAPAYELIPHEKRGAVVRRRPRH